MCEFCTKHGEGKKWYLQMKNYSRELLTVPLTPEQRRVAGVRTRARWLESFTAAFINPGAAQPASAPARSPAPPPSEDEYVRRRKIVHFGQVLPIADVFEVLAQVTSITRIPCGCRYITTGKVDKRYCFGLGYDPNQHMGWFPDRSAGLEVLTREEARRIIQDYDREGLIHSIWTGVTPFVIGICNCDHDCLAYRDYISEGGPADFFRAEYIAEVDWELCTGCKACMKQCQFGAQGYSHARGKVSIDPLRCFGCGVCMAVCKQSAIRLLPRAQHPKAKDLWLKPQPAGTGT